MARASVVAVGVAAALSLGGLALALLGLAGYIQCFLTGPREPEDNAGRRTAQPPAQAPRLAWIPPATAWSAYVHDRDAKEVDEKRLAEWQADVRAALPTWTPTSPWDRLALARFADAVQDRAALAKWLESLADDKGESGRVAATWLVTVHLQAHDPEGAAKALARLKSAFDGEGLDREGRHVPADLMAEALVDEAVAAARSRVEGLTPDVARAMKALEIAGLWAKGDAFYSIKSAERYVGLSDVALDRTTAVGNMTAAGRPRILVFSDDFQLGEPILPSVIKRWSRGVPVVVVGRLTGHIRQGIRRVKAETPSAEMRAVDRRVEDLGLKVDGFVGRESDFSGKPAGPPDLGFALGGGLGLGEGAVVFVLDKDGRIVARMSGNSLDPRPLDPVVARLVPDSAAIAPPK